MTKQELVDVCSKRIDDLTYMIDNPPVEYEFYTDFAKSYNYKTFSGLLKIPYVDFASALLYPVVEDKNINDVLGDVLSFQNILDCLSSDELHLLNDIFLGFIHSDKVDLLKTLFSDTNARRAVIKARNMMTDSKLDNDDKEVLSTTHDILEKLIVNSRKTGWDVLTLIDYYAECPATTSNVISLIRVFKYIKDGREEITDFNSKEFKEKYNTRDVFKICDNITECKRHICEAYKRIESSTKHKLHIYKKFLKDIENAFNSEEIKNYEMIVHDLDDEEFKEEFLKLVYQHNKIKYDEIDAIHEELTKNSLVNYLTVLKNNGIKKDEVDLNKITRNSCEDIDKMLKILNAIVGDRKVILRILEISDLFNVSYFKELKSKNVLSTKAFIKYPSIFDRDSEIRKVLDTNISIVTEYKLDFTIFSKCPEVLVENERLGTNLEILNNYKLLSNIKYTNERTNTLGFLRKDNLCELIDKIIELGYEGFLTESLDLLNEDNWDRIYVLKSMGLKPDNKKDLIKYLRDDKFFVPDNKLKLYIEDTSEYYENIGIDSDIDIKEFIKDNEITVRTLCINGVMISKNRVLRNISGDSTKVNDLFKGIISNSILSMDEVESIKTGIKNKVYKISE